MSHLPSPRRWVFRTALRPGPSACSPSISPRSVCCWSSTTANTSWMALPSWPGRCCADARTSRSSPRVARHLAWLARSSNTSNRCPCRIPRIAPPVRRGGPTLCRCLSSAPRLVGAGLRSTRTVRRLCWSCAHLDGLPLALELAAVRLDALGIEALSSGLRTKMEMLGTGNPSHLPHQRTMEATIDWSYQLLTPEEKLLFARLSVFVGGFRDRRSPTGLL